MSYVFFFHCCGALRDLHSFPTRRSSDLSARLLAPAAPFLSDWIHRALVGASVHLAPYPTDLGRRAPELLQRSEEHTSELQSRGHLVCRLLLEKKKQQHTR